MRLDMTTKPSSTPEERLTKSRSEIVNFMQKDNQILHILQPVVASYAKSNPMKTLGIAAGVGAAMVVLLAVLKARM
jgi:ElaB/YqjD/DUF883 family membrane-anchored ribosome-binding protein